MILQTERLYLRLFTYDDIEWLAKIYSDIDVMRFISTGKTVPYEMVKEGIQVRIKRYKEYGFWEEAVINKEGDKPMGHCGFAWLQDNSDIEIAYLLDKPYWGKGYATEIVAGTLNYGFEKLGV